MVACLWIAPADIINLSGRREHECVQRGAARQGEGGGRRMEEQTLLGLLLHIKPKRKQSSHLPNPKRLPLLVFLRVMCVYLLYCKTFHVGKCVVL